MPATNMSFYDKDYYEDSEPAIKVHHGAGRGGKGGISTVARNEANRRIDLITKEMVCLDNRKFSALACDKPLIEHEIQYLKEMLQKLAVFLGSA